MLGGSSSHNGMKYIKGLRYDYQTWYDKGNRNWHPDVVFEYFKKLENLQNQELLKDPEINNKYGKNGPVVVNRFNSSNNFIINGVLDSLNEIGIKTVKDLNTAGLLGAGISTATAANGKRVSSATAYLNTIRSRKNLKVLTNAFVLKILINKSKTAYGVRVKYKGKIMTLLTKREVILCAGATKSPQLLMLSGIGPKEILNSKNIKCKFDQPNVGQNLQDHCYVPITIYGNGLLQPYNTKLSAIEYLSKREGRLAQSSEEIFLAFYSKDMNSTKPDYQLHFTIFWKNSSQVQSVFGKSNLNYKRSVVDLVKKQTREQTLYLLEFHNLRPLSRGYITLRSNNPEDQPSIYPNYFGNEADLDNSVEGIMRITNLILKTKYFSSENANIGLFWEPCAKYVINSRKYWKCICLSAVTTIYHPVGTCQMGPNSKTAVVNDELKVYGVKKLRVIDASIMPTITSGNTYGPTVMIAERACDLVKNEYKR